MRSHHPFFSKMFFLLALLASAMGASQVGIAQGTAPTATASKAAAPTADQLWYGELNAGPRVLRMLFQVNSDPNKSVLISIDEGEKEFRFDSFQIADGKMQFKINGGEYNGELNSEKTVANGEWVQNGHNIPFVIKKVEKRPVDQPQEIWTGTLDAGVQKLILQFRIYEEKEGKPVAFMDSLSQKAGGFRVEMEREEKQVKFKCAAINASFVGDLSEDGKGLKGKWKQGVEMDLELKRVEQTMDAKVAEAKRPQTPVAPFPYDIEKVKFRNEKDKISLAGTLTLPKSASPVAVAILVSGSGPQNRDEELMEHRPFWVLADHLGRQGIAVLRYDDRGVAESEGDFGSGTSADFAEDASAAVDFLAKHPKIDAKKIGIIGHSEGGLIAPMVATKKPNVAWIVLMAGTGVNGARIIESQSALIAKAANTSEKDLKILDMAIKTALRVLTTSTSTDDTELDEAYSKAIREELKTAGIEIKEDDPAIQNLVSPKILASLKGPWMKYFLAHEPAPVLEKVKCSVLALNGEKDLQVDPALNLPAIEKALKAGGNRDFTIRQFPNLNHLFQTCTTGSPTEYHAIEETLHPSLLSTITDWIKAR